MPSSDVMQRFDRLLEAMLTKPPLDAGGPTPSDNEAETDDWRDGEGD